MTDPLALLKSKIAAQQDDQEPTEEVKTEAAAAPKADTQTKKDEAPAYQSLAAHKASSMFKAKTPNPRRRYHAKSTSFASFHSEGKPFVLGVSNISVFN